MMFLYKFLKVCLSFRISFRKEEDVLFDMSYETGMGLIAKFIVKRRKIINEYYI